MNISQIAVRRTVEVLVAEDAAYRRKLERSGRPLICHVRRMADDELIAKLHALKIDIDRVKLEEVSRGYLAAYELANALLDQNDFDGPEPREDWAWFAIETLWQRWFPERPNLEMVDDLMHAGYAALERQDSAGACRQWQPTWLAILDLMQRFRIKTISAFDERFGGSQCVFNWVQDYESELYNAGRDDAQFFHDRIALCQVVIERFNDDPLRTENFRSALAESHFELGQRETGDRLFRHWLDDDPRWGWGWIAWSDCHYLFAAENKDADRALQILRQGLNVAGVHDRKEILSRLESVLADAGRENEAADFRRQREQAADEDEDEGMDNMGSSTPTPRIRADSLTMPLSEHLDGRQEGSSLGSLGKFMAVLRGGGLPFSDDRIDSSAGAGKRQGNQATSGPHQRVGRNASCPCGSGKKFKKCCGRRKT